MPPVNLTKLQVINIIANNFATAKAVEASVCEEKIVSESKIRETDREAARGVYAPIIEAVVRNGIPNTHKEILVDSILDKLGKSLLDKSLVDPLRTIFSALDPTQPAQLDVLIKLNDHLAGKDGITHVEALNRIERFPSISSNNVLNQLIQDIKRRLIQPQVSPGAERVTTSDEQTIEQGAEPKGFWGNAWKWVRRGIVAVLTILGAKNLFNAESGWAKPIIQLLAALGISRLDFESKGDKPANAEAATQTT